MSHDKDITEKHFEAINAIFADIFNVLVFHGDQVLHPDDLSDATARSQIKVDGGIHEQERDVAKVWKSPGGPMILALCGVENQTAPDPDIALRCIAYDGATYKQQVNQHNRKTEKSLPTYPAITLVLYFGTKPWTKGRTLFDSFDVKIDSRMKPYIHDYSANIIEMMQLPPETVNLCRSDFRYLVDWAIKSASQENPYDLVDGPIDYPDELFKLMSVLAGDHRFEDAYNNVKLNGTKEDVRMCNVVNNIEAHKAYQIAVSLFKKGVNPETIKDVIKENVPDFSDEQLAAAKKEAELK